MLNQWSQLSARPAPRVRFPTSGLVISGRPDLVIGTVPDTNSMLPVCDAGHTLLMLPAPVDLAVGDFAAYAGADGRIAAGHRITKVNGDWFYFKGDNNIWPDPAPVHRSAIRYVVIGVMY